MSRGQCLVELITGMFCWHECDVEIVVRLACLGFAWHACACGNCVMCVVCAYFLACIAFEASKVCACGVRGVLVENDM